MRGAKLSKDRILPVEGISCGLSVDWSGVAANNYYQIDPAVDSGTARPPDTSIHPGPLALGVTSHQQPFLPLSSQAILKLLVFVVICLRDFYMPRYSPIVKLWRGFVSAQHGTALYIVRFDCHKTGFSS